MVRFAKALIYACGLMVAVAGSSAIAQKAPATVVPNKPTDAATGALADAYESKSAGIAFRPPAGSKEINKAGVPDLIVEFVNEDHAWLLRAATLELKEPRKLADSRDENGRSQRGILTETNDAFTRQNPTAQVLRNEVVETDRGPVGSLAYRYAQGPTDRLMQQAFFRLTDKYYYVLTMTSPGAKGASGDTVDEREKLAVDTFSDVVKSVRLIDRSELARDQAARLKATRAYLSEFRAPKLMNKAIIPEQWWRLTRDGQDIGYSYVVEERSKQDGREGVLISVRSRTVAGPGQQVDVSSRMFISDNWQHESWSHVVNTLMDGKADDSAELGLSDLTLHYKVDAPKDLLSQAPTSKPTDPDIQEITRFKLQVRSKIGPTVAQPFERELPQEYLPQAIKHLLARMLPLDKPEKYIFITYVSDTHQPMLAYADVQPQREVTIDNQIIIATPVEYRVGLEGVPTTYFIGKDGKYLGSETVYKVQGKNSTIRVLPTDEATLLKLWKTAQLQKPQASEVPDLPAAKKK